MTCTPGRLYTDCMLTASLLAPCNAGGGAATDPESESGSTRWIEQQSLRPGTRHAIIEESKGVTQYNEAQYKKTFRGYLIFDPRDRCSISAGDASGKSIDIGRRVFARSVFDLTPEFATFTHRAGEMDYCIGNRTCFDLVSYSTR